MTPLLIAALVAILSVQPTLRISIIDAPVTQIHTSYGEVVESPGAYGWTECVDGRVVRIVHNGNVGTFLHEALHSASCALTGEMKGGLLPVPCTVEDCEHAWISYAFTHQAEAVKIMEGVR